MKRAGRALGSGKLIKATRANGQSAWLLDWRGADGTRRRKFLGQDKRNAERQRNEIMSQRDLELAGLASIEGQSRELRDVAEYYLRDLGGNCTARHVLEVRRRIERLIGEVKAPRVRDLKIYHLTEYRTQRLAAGAAPRTVNHQIGSLKAMLSWAVGAGLIAENPVHALEPLYVGEEGRRHVRRAMTEEEIARFLGAARDDDAKMAAYFAAEATIKSGTKGRDWCARTRTRRIPQYALWLSFLETGARFFELTRVCWADLDTTGRTITLRSKNTKNRRQRLVPLHDSHLAEIQALRPIQEAVLGRTLTGEDLVFLAPEGGPWQRCSKNTLILFRRVLKLAGIDAKNARDEHLDLHALRHTCGTRLSNLHVPITHTQKLLGHATIELTAKYYTHIAVDDLRRELDRIQPLSSAGVGSSSRNAQT